VVYFSKFNLDQFCRIFHSVFTAPLPAGTIVEVARLARPEFLIEVEAVAVVGAAPELASHSREERAR